MRFKPTSSPSPTALDTLTLASSIPVGEKKFFAFKALGRDFIRVSGEEGAAHEEEEGKSAKDMVELVSARIRAEYLKVGGEKKDLIVVKDIRSLVLSFLLPRSTMLTSMMAIDWRRLRRRRRCLIEE